MKYDTIVVGAGIAGIATAFFLRRMGQKVLLVDKKGPLAGASGQRGPFCRRVLARGATCKRSPTTPTASR
jgi:glycine/D-amino acid oxidase-like deaminating enzyme